MVSPSEAVIYKLISDKNEKIERLGGALAASKEREAGLRAEVERLRWMAKEFLEWHLARGGSENIDYFRKMFWEQYESKARRALNGEEEDNA